MSAVGALILAAVLGIFALCAVGVVALVRHGKTTQTINTDGDLCAALGGQVLDDAAGFTFTRGRAFRVRVTRGKRASVILWTIPEVAVQAGGG